MGLPNGPNALGHEACAGSYSLDNIHTISGYRIQGVIISSSHMHLDGNGYPCEWHVTWITGESLSLKYPSSSEADSLGFDMLAMKYSRIIIFPVKEISLTFATFMLPLEASDIWCLGY
jgi:hypothetical protein